MTGKTKNTILVIVILTAAIVLINPFRFGKQQATKNKPEISQNSNLDINLNPNINKSPTPNPGPNEARTTSEKLREAINKGKPVFLEFYSDN